MSGKGKKSPSCSQPKKKKRRTNTKKNTKGQSETVSGVNTVNTVSTLHSSVTSNTLNCDTPQNAYNMASFPNPQMQIPGTQAPPPPMTFQYSPTSQGMAAPFNFGQQMQMQMNTKPEWANELTENMKLMSKELGKLGNIEKTLSGIKLSVSNLENKVEAMESKLVNCEKSCSFLSKEYDTQKKDLSAAKTNISTLQKRCTELESKCQDYENKSSKMHSKLLDLESRNMRENLVFHGIPENVSENCEEIVKQFCHEKLAMLESEVKDIVLDRVHRIGRIEKLKPNAIRPIVAKFHRYSDREKVRQLGFELKDALKGENKAVRPQLPSEVLENRKPLYSVMEKAKAKGSKVKFVLDKLYINGKEYKPPVTTGATGTSV